MADLSDQSDSIRGIGELNARCSAGPCSDFANNIVTMSQNHVSAGIQGEVTLALPPFFRGGLGTLGVKLQLSLGGFDESGLFVYYPGPDLKPNGLMFDGDLGFNVAIGSGPWSGAFNNYALGVGPLAMSTFVAPGWMGTGPGYAGFSLGIGAGPPGAAFTQTYYVPLTGQR